MQIYFDSEPNLDSLIFRGVILFFKGMLTKLSSVKMHSSLLHDVFYIFFFFCKPLGLENSPFVKSLISFNSDRIFVLVEKQRL